jgi:hypothetical protein
MTQDKFPKTEFQKEREQWWKEFGKKHRGKFKLDIMDYFTIIMLISSIIAFTLI